jgi:hypothetical protein
MFVSQLPGLMIFEKFGAGNKSDILPADLFGLALKTLERCFGDHQPL